MQISKDHHNFHERDGAVAWNECKNAADKQAAIYAISLACKPRATEGDLAVAIRMLDRLADAEVKRSQERADASWHSWVKESLLNGASRAHKWANAPNQMIGDVKAGVKEHPQEIAEAVRDEWAEEWKSFLSERSGEADCKKETREKF